MTKTSFIVAMSGEDIIDKCITFFVNLFLTLVEIVFFLAIDNIDISE